MANGSEESYRQGYRDGFKDGLITSGRPKEKFEKNKIGRPRKKKRKSDLQ